MNNGRNNENTTEERQGKKVDMDEMNCTSGKKMAAKSIAIWCVLMIASAIIWLFVQYS